MKEFTFILLIIVSISRNTSAKTITESISDIEKRLNTSIIYNEIVKDSWSSVTYDECNDSVATMEYLIILDREYSKYPKGYFQLIGIKNLILGTNLKFQNQHRAAIPDPYTGSLYLSVDGSHPGISVEYLIHVMHHELSHCTEYAIWKNMYYRWELWENTNLKSFRYAGSGVMAYENKLKDWYSITHPEIGFLNSYSMTSEEEDRCELVALIMSDEERKFIFQYYPMDEVLRKKVGIILTMLSKLCKTTDTYWENKLASLVKK